MSKTTILTSARKILTVRPDDMYLYDNQLYAARLRLKKEAVRREREKCVLLPYCCFATVISLSVIPTVCVMMSCFVYDT